MTRLLSHPAQRVGHEASALGGTTLEEYLADAEAAGIIDFSLRIVRSPEGLLDFYIHPDNKDGATADFHVSGAFVSRLCFGAGSSRNTVSPLVGSPPPSTKDRSNE